MRDDELGRLVRRSLEGHADDVRPSPDLGEWVVERKLATVVGPVMRMA